MQSDVPVTFVNLVLGRGSLNNVINLTLGVLNFTPNDDHIDPDPVIVSRLRMDVECARDLYNQIGEILAAIDAKRTAASNGLDTEVVAGKPN